MPASRFESWDDVTAFALTLPGTAIEKFYAGVAVKVEGKPFVSQGREADSFHVWSSHDEKAVLLETDPAAFWQTPHYETWPGLLVRYGSEDRERIERVITRAWWDKAKRPLRVAFGVRP